MFEKPRRAPPVDSATSANVSLRNSNESTASLSLAPFAGRRVAPDPAIRPVDARELISALASGESSPVGSSATIVARARSACDSASFASARKFQRPRAEKESPFGVSSSPGCRLYPGGRSGDCRSERTSVTAPASRRRRRSAATKPVGEIGPARTTTVLGSGRFATLSRTVVKFRSIWRDWPTHSSPRASEKTYDRGSIFAGFSSAFFSAERSDVKPCRPPHAVVEEVDGRFLAGRHPAGVREQRLEAVVPRPHVRVQVRDHEDGAVHAARGDGARRGRLGGSRLARRGPGEPARQRTPRAPRSSRSASPCRSRTA